MKTLTPENLAVPTLGARVHKSPLSFRVQGVEGNTFVPDEARVRYFVDLPSSSLPAVDPLFEKAGPRELLFYKPEEVRAAIVTCGGLCPGLNNVVRSVFLALYHNYGVKNVFGVRYGYEGLNPAAGHSLIPITTDFVEHIQEEGGSVLGTSRGPQPAEVIVDFLVSQKINMLFCVGGDGTQRGAHSVYEEVRKRGLPISIIGIPKTIDNDIMYVDRTFGLSTAIEEAQKILDCAHNEAHGQINGVGLVKVMGREAGFIAAGAALSNQEVNFALIPEVPFSMDGEQGFLNLLRKRLAARAHAVVVVAEGAGQELFREQAEGRDASGNIKFGDIGIFMKDRINAYFKQIKTPVNVKYFDPSYAIRSVPANCDDSMLCDRLARNAVHAGMAGKTDVLMGYWNTAFTHVPIPLATGQKKRVDPHSDLWLSVLAATGQPPQMI
jgi:6-phosphofructokinase 1